MVKTDLKQVKGHPSLIWSFLTLTTPFLCASWPVLSTLVARFWPKTCSRTLSVTRCQKVTLLMIPQHRREGRDNINDTFSPISPLPLLRACFLADLINSLNTFNGFEQGDINDGFTSFKDHHRRRAGILRVFYRIDQKVRKCHQCGFNTFCSDLIFLTFILGGERGFKRLLLKSEESVIKCCWSWVWEA